MAATRPELVDGAFQQLPDRQHLTKLAAIVGRQFPQHLALAASAENTAGSWLFEPVNPIA